MTELDEAKGVLARRRTAYVKTFDSNFGDEVIRDLAKFCRANESTFNPDARAHAVLEGRREVWLRIQHHLRLTDEELWRIYSGTPIYPKDKTNV